MFVAYRTTAPASVFSPDSVGHCLLSFAYESGNTESPAIASVFGSCQVGHRIALSKKAVRKRISVPCSRHSRFIACRPTRAPQSRQHHIRAAPCAYLRLEEKYADGRL